MSPPRKDFEPFGDPARHLRDTIAPGTTGDPHDTMDDFPLIRDAGEKPRSNHYAEDPGAFDERNYGFDANGSKRARNKLLQSSREFVAGYVPPMVTASAV
jgi:hypothetical protein